MHGENKVLIKETGNTDNYEISLLNARLSLQYFKLETNVRTTWYDLVNSENIRRVVPTSHIRYAPAPTSHIRYAPAPTLVPVAAPAPTIALPLILPPFLSMLRPC